MYESNFFVASFPFLVCRAKIQNRKSKVPHLSVKPVQPSAVVP